MTSSTAVPPPSVGHQRPLIGSRVFLEYSEIPYDVLLLFLAVELRGTAELTRRRLHLHV